MTQPSSRSGVAGAPFICDDARMTTTIQLPALYPAQHAALYDSARYSVIEGSTKSGKTQGCIIWQASRAMSDPGVHWWVAPVYAQAKIAYRRTKGLLPKGIIARTSATDLEIELTNGSVWQFRSAEKPDNLYGEDVRSAVIDEASRCRDESWHAVRSTLTATRGPIRAIGNVRGRTNWHYQLARKAEGGEPDHHFARLTAWDAVRGGVIARAEVEDARRILPDAVFRELYLCEPSDDGGNPFGIDAIAACVAPLSTAAPAVWGVDYARVHDWTVAIALDRGGRMCRVERWQSSLQETVERVVSLCGRVPGYFDATGPGDALGELIAPRGVALQPVVYTNARKQEMMEALSAAIQQKRISVTDGVVRSELEAFEYGLSASRRLVYSAPSGMHDDAVNALALAWLAARDVYAMHVDRRATSTAKAPVPKRLGVGGFGKVSRI